jgi:prepilin-type N-terminal cleavage/methylation domain-containing protein
MIKCRRGIKTEKGFTLLEVIITITIGAILASFLVAFMGTAITNSSDPLKQVRDLGTSSGNIETASADYASYLTSGIPNWTTFKTNRGGCAAACTSGSTNACCTVTGGGIYSSGFETIQVMVTNSNQKLVSYFTQ